MNILEYGINDKYEKSLDYAENYMREKKQNEKQNPVEAEQNFKAMKDTFSEFNEFIVRLCTKVRFPFSKELYGISSRNYKFQISIAMIVAGIFKERLFKKRLLQEIMKDDKKVDVFMKVT